MPSNAIQMNKSLLHNSLKLKTIYFVLEWPVVSESH